MANEPLAHGVNIDSMLQENRVFPPSAEFSAKAHIKSLEEYERIYAEAAANPEAFWAGVAKELHWFEPWTKVLEWDAPWAKWFVGGKINISYNCLDRHVIAGHGDKIAFLWEGEPGDARTLTYTQMLAQVELFANVLKGLGVVKGDRVTLYMGMVPELAIAMLACARIGAVHSVIFGGFSANAIVDRVNDQQATVVVTQDFARRRGTQFPLKGTVDEALVNCPTVKHVVVYQRTGAEINMQSGRDHWWHELVAKAAPHCPAEHLDSEDPLYILYTSGSTGKPKGIVHTTGGYSVGTYITSKWIFDLKDDDIFWCTADIGWVTGHSYIVYGPLQNGATTRDVRRRAELPGPRPLLGADREVQGQHFLHRANRHPDLHQVGQSISRSPRPEQPPPARYCRRAHQSRSLDVVSRSHRQGALPHRRHLVADGDGMHHDHAAPGRHRHQTRLCHPAIPGNHRRGGRSRRRKGSARLRWLPGDQEALARHGCAPSMAIPNAM